jgi:hypothetical protein
MVTDAVPAESAGGEGIAGGISRGGNHRAVKLGVITGEDVIAAVTGKQAALVTDAGVFAVDFAGTDAAPHRTARFAEGDAEAAAGALVVVNILQAGHRQVITDVRHRAIAESLCAGEQRIVAAAESQGVSDADAAVNEFRAVAVVRSTGDIAAGLDTNSGFLTIRKMAADAPVGVGAELLRAQVNVTLRAECGIPRGGDYADPEEGVVSSPLARKGMPPSLSR